MPVALLSSTPVLRDTYVGTWSPYTLLLAIFMIFLGLVLTVVLLIFAMMGRLSTRSAPRGEFDPELLDHDPEAPSIDMALKRSQKTALRKAQKEESERPENHRRKTGWISLVAAIACSAASMVVFRQVDNPFGKMQGFTFGTVLNLLLFGLQLCLTIRFVLCQRRLGQ